MEGVLLRGAATSITTADASRGGGDDDVIDLDKGGVATPAHPEDKAAGWGGGVGHRRGEPPRATINLRCKKWRGVCPEALALAR